jgi:hypothetical protein
VGEPASGLPAIRSNLLAIAEKAAARAESADQPAEALGWAQTAKTAVEGAAAAEMPASEIEAALDDLADVVREAGLEGEASMYSPTDFLRAVLVAFVNSQREAKLAGATMTAYEQVRDRLRDVTKTATNSENPASQRMGAASQAVIDDAEQKIREAQRGS